MSVTNRPGASVAGTDECERRIREMAITPNEIKNAAFSPAENEVGYDPIEVDEFLDIVSDEVDQLMKRVVELKTRYTQAENRAQSASTEAAGLRQQLDAQRKSQVDGQLSETQLSEVFVIAKQTADKMISDAESNASRITADAEAKAAETIREVLVDKQREIDEINRLQQLRGRFAADFQGFLQNYLDEALTRLPIAAENMPDAEIDAVIDEAGSAKAATA